MNRCDALFPRFLQGIQRSMPIMALLSVVFAHARTMAAELSFKLHYIDQDTAWATSAMQMSLTDLNNDGRLDWTVGNVYTNPNFYWYEYQAPDHWVKHTIVEGSAGKTTAAAAVLDVNGDGTIDLVIKGWDGRDVDGKPQKSASFIYLENTTGK